MNRFANFTLLASLSLLIFVNSIFGQSESIYRLPAGTRISLTVDAEISSKVASVNDTFIATVTKPLSIREVVVLPAGTILEGRVADVSSAAVGGRDGTLDVVFETMKISNSMRKIQGVMVTQVMADSSRTFNVLTILGGLAAGTSVGAANSRKGALVGAAVGAAAGTGIALLRKGKEVRIRKGEQFEIELKKEVVLPVLDY